MKCVVCGSDSPGTRKTCSKKCFSERSRQVNAEYWTKERRKARRDEYTNEKKSEHGKIVSAALSLRTEEEKNTHSIRQRESWTPERRKNQEEVRNSWSEEERERQSRLISEARSGRYGRDSAKGYHIDKSGYKVLHGQKSHPLANKAGQVSEHRAVLYEEIGPGPHKCHWCSKELEWGGVKGIHADHLDGDGLNNSPNNLVPSCNNCNWGREYRESKKEAEE